MIIEDSDEYKPSSRFNILLYQPEGNVIMICLATLIVVPTVNHISNLL